MPIVVLAVLVAPFPLAWWAFRRDRPGVAWALLIAGAAGALVVLGFMSWLASDCFVIFGEEPARCEGNSKMLELLVVAWAISLVAALLVAVWSFGGAKGSAVLAGVVAAVALVWWVVAQAPWERQGTRLPAEGTISFVMCLPGEWGARGPCTTYTVPADGSEKAVVVTVDGSMPPHPEPALAATSPDQTKVARIAENPPSVRPEAGAWGLYLDTPNESGRLLLDLAQPSMPPIWSPEGRYILVLHGYSDELFVVDTIEGEARKLHGRTSSCPAPTWSPDGDHVAFATYSYGRHCHELHVVQRNGDYDRRLTSLEECSMAGVLRWDP